MGIGDWGLGIGDWGLGIGEWGESPIPDTQSPIPIFFLFIEKNHIKNKKIYFYLFIYSQ